MTRKQINKALTKPDEWIGAALEAIEECKDQMQEYFDEKSERWQEGDNGQEYQGLIDELENVISSLNDAQSSLQEVIE